MILYCIPYAGGTEQSYRKWDEYVSSSIEIKTIELKGRGNRYREGNYSSIEAAVEDIYARIKNEIKTNKYAIYGHSMGAILAFELYYKIESERNRLPKHIFFSGKMSPYRNKCNYLSTSMPDDIFIDRMGRLGGTPKELLESSELLGFLLPIIKNDVRILENYDFKDKENKIKCAISVLNGKEDKFELCNELKWDKLCNAECTTYELDGGHFFIYDDMNTVLSIIEQHLCLN